MQLITLSEYPSLVLPNSSSRLSQTTTRELSSSGAKGEMEGFPWEIHKVEVRCPCGSSFEDADTYLRHRGFCTNHEEETSIGSKSSGARRRAPIAPAKPPGTARNIGCACGRMFAKRAALDMHLRTSKAHQAEKIRPTEELISLTPNAVRPTTLDASLPPPPPASAPLPDTIPYATLSVMQLLHCTCGHSFET